MSSVALSEGRTSIGIIDSGNQDSVNDMQHAVACVHAAACDGSDHAAGCLKAWLVLPSLTTMGLQRRDLGIIHVTPRTRHPLTRLA